MPFENKEYSLNLSQNTKSIGESTDRKDHPGNHLTLAASRSFAEISLRNYLVEFRFIVGIAKLLLSNQGA
jgi:hypothetical protein